MYCFILLDKDNNTELNENNGHIVIAIVVPVVVIIASVIVGTIIIALFGEKLYNSCRKICGKSKLATATHSY